MRRNRRGFTLMELIVTVGILGIIFMVLCAGPVYLLSRGSPVSHNDYLLQQGVVQYDVVRPNHTPISCTDQGHSFRIKYSKGGAEVWADVCYDGVSSYEMHLLTTPN